MGSLLAANSAPPAAPTPATVHPNDGLPRPKLLRGSIFSADAEALGFYNVSADVRSEFGVRDVRVSVGSDPAGDAANASVPLAPRPPLRLRLVGVAVSQWPAGPYTWAWARWRQPRRWRRRSADDLVHVVAAVATDDSHCAGHVLAESHPHSRQPTTDDFRL